jgi:large subunit ribosomal protein L15
MAIKITTVKPARGAVKARKRLGCGTGSGHGGTSTRGHKGVKARSGPNIPAWFDGGQMPLQRRLPKVGFTSPRVDEYLRINVGDLNDLAVEGVLDLPALKKAGLLHGRKLKLKVLGMGELTRALTIKADAFSQGAIDKIQKSGGTVQLIEKPRRPKRFAKKPKA